MKIAICDDNENIIEELKDIIQEFFSAKNIPLELYCFCNGKELISTGEKFDLAIVDIEMPEVNGIEAAKYVQQENENAVIIIVTSHQEYLDDAMDINVYRYLPKPIEKDRFIRGLEGAVVKYMKVSSPVIIETENEIVNSIHFRQLYANVYLSNTQTSDPVRYILYRYAFHVPQ